MNIGSVFTGHVQEQLSQNKVLVNVDGKDIVMHFSRGSIVSGTIKGRVTAVDKGVFLAQLLDSSTVEDEIFTEFRYTFSEKEIANVLRIFKHFNWSLDSDKIRQLLNLNRLFGNNDVAVAVFFKKLDYQVILSLWESLENFDINKNMKILERCLEKSSSKIKAEFSPLIENLDASKFNLKFFLSFFLLDFEEKMLKKYDNIKHSFKFFLKELLNGNLDESEKKSLEELIKKNYLDNIKSLSTKDYKMFFYSIPLKEKDQWHLMNVAVKEIESHILIQWQYEFSNLGPVIGEASISKKDNTRKLRLGVINEDVREYLKTHLQSIVSAEYFFILQGEETKENFMRKVNVFV